MDEVRAPGRGMSLRCARALGVSSLAWAVASAAHVLAGGPAPGAAGVVCLVVLTAWPLVAVLGGVPSRARMVLVLLAAQGVMHSLMELLSTSMSGSSGSSALLAGGHHGHSFVAAEHAAAAPLTQRSVGPGLDLVPSPAMIGVHVLAALLLGVVLVNGERLLRAVLDLLAAVLLPIASQARVVLAALRATSAPLLEPGRVSPARVASVRPDRHLLDVVACSVVRRGPPATA